MGFKPTRKGKEKGALGERVCYAGPLLSVAAHTHFPLKHTKQRLLRPITLSQTRLVRCGRVWRRVQVLLAAAAALLSGSIKGNYCWW